MKRTLGIALLALVFSGCDRLLERQMERNVTRVDESVLTSPDLQVVICGSGSPLADAERASSCAAVIAGGEFVVVDTGPGSWEVLDLANLPIARLSAVLLTHFHSDHIGGLGEATTQSWIAGRVQPLDVYGPDGVGRVVAGFAEAYAFDVDHRVAHHTDAYMPRAAAGAVAHEVALGDAANAAAIVFERNGLKVTMFRVDHDPVRPAVGYRFDFAGRSIAISGDTKKSASLIEHAKGVDILFHEALQSEMIRRASRVAARLGRERLSKLAADITDYHTTPVEAAEVARDAGAAQLVFTHLVPGPNNFLTRRLFLAGVADVFKGQVVIAEDGMRFSLPPK